jgi:hypothetical protein
MVTKKMTLLLLTAVITLYYISFFVGTLTRTTEASEATVPMAVQQHKPWKNWEDYDPQWETFKEDHPQYEYQETEIYRGTRRSVNRFYSKR